MKIQYMTSVSEEVWQTLVETSDDTWLYHTQAWLNLTTRVWPFENHYFVAEHKGHMQNAMVIIVMLGRYLWA